MAPPPASAEPAPWASGPPGVEVEAVSKAYQRHKPVLSQVSLSVRAGETLGIIGPNGAGKTTLFGCMLGLLWPDSGRVLIGGLPPDHLAVRRITGYLPERLSFDPGSSARQSVALHHALMGLPPRERARDVEALLTRVGLDPAAWDRNPRTFSRGMLQRLGLAQALVGRPRVLFLDEPTLGIDPDGLLHLRALLRELKAEGITILINSHDLAQLERMCDRVAMFRAGRVAALEDLAAPTVTRTRHVLRVRWAGSQSLTPEQLTRVAQEAGAAWQQDASVEDVLGFSVEDDWSASRLLKGLMEAGLAVASAAREEGRLERFFQGPGGPPP